MNYYVWDGKTVIHTDYGLDPNIGTYVYSPDSLDCKWHQVGGTRRYVVWAEKSKEEVPSEFKVRLLLMGVPM